MNEQIIIDFHVQTLIYKFHDGVVDKVEKIEIDGCSYLVVLVINGIPESSHIIKP